jgi:hypothetical protein
LSADSELLVALLARPRKLGQVAEHFGISLSEAERRIVLAVEQGWILVNPRLPSGAVSPKLRKESWISLAPRSRPVAKAGRLPQTRNSTIHSRMNLGNIGRLRFKLRGEEPNPIRRNPARLTPSEILGRKVTATRKSNRISLSLEAHLLKTLGDSPEKLDDFRAAFGVSHKTLGGLVRRGLLSRGWGPGGVGNSYRITKHGLMELRRLEAASSMGSKNPKKRLMSLKLTAASPAY